MRMRIFNGPIRTLLARACSEHEFDVGIYALPRRPTAAASLMEGLPSQVGDVRTPLAAATPAPIQNVEQSDVSYAISVTGRSSFLTAQLSIRSGALFFNATAPTSRFATSWTNSSRR